MQARKRVFLQKSINNFAFPAYNNGVEEITITQNGFDGRYMSYLYAKVRERFSFLPAVCDITTQGDLSEIDFKTEQAYCPYVRRFAEENMADVIAIGYKYAYFDKNLKLPLLTQEQKRLLCTALVSADLKEDRTYAFRKLHGAKKYSLDGVYHFRLRELTRRWKDVADYVPMDMSEVSLDGFIDFLAEEGENKLFVKDDKVYDAEYRPLSKSALTGKESAVAEILLANAGRVYCFGETEKTTRAFLQKYYKDKVVFC